MAAYTAVKAATWKNGNVMSVTGAGPCPGTSPRASAASAAWKRGCVAAPAWARWVATAPLGRPVVPDV